MTAPPPTDTYDYAAASRAIAFSAGRVTRKFGMEHWAEDVAQEAMELLIHARRKGIHGGGRMFRLLSLQAFSRIFVTGRASLPRLWMERHADVADAPQDEVASGPRAIALWRLQSVWTTLTGIQRSAVEQWLVGAPNCPSTHSALESVIAKLNGEAPKMGMRKPERNAAIVAMREGGASLRAIAEKFGIANQSVDRILRREHAHRLAARHR